MKGKNIINKTTFISSKITATISISLVLFLLGLIVLLSLITNNLSIFVKENLSFSIVLANDMKESDIKKLQYNIENSLYAKSTEYISKERALEELKEDLGDNPEAFLGFNPLPASINVKLKSEYANNDSIAIIEKKLKQNSNIRDITYRQDLLDSVNKNIKKIGLALAFLAILLLIISVALISNTIRLMIYSKRFLIYTMKLVGATNSFIRKPLIYSNLIMGIIASIIAMCLLLCLAYYGSRGLNDFSILISTESLIIVFAAIIISGILISIIATYFAINKYLRLKGDDMYYI